MSEFDLDPIDRRILGELQRNGRISNVDLAAAVGLSPSPCLRRVRDLENGGVIDRYAAIIDQNAAGRSLSVFVQVTLERQIETALDAFERSVSERPEVMECYLMTGEFDYLLRVVVSNMADFERLHNEALTRLPGVARVNSSVAIRTVTKTTELPLS